MADDEYAKLKSAVKIGKTIKNAEIYDARPGWDMIMLSNPNADAVAFIGTDAMTKKVRIGF